MDDKVWPNLVIFLNVTNYCCWMDASCRCIDAWCYYIMVALCWVKVATIVSIVLATSSMFSVGGGGRGDLGAITLLTGGKQLIQLKKAKNLPNKQQRTTTGA